MSHPLEERFLRSFPHAERGQHPCLVALSGGPDSVALLHLLFRTHGPDLGRIIVAHVNHKLRGHDSDEDAKFCEELAESLGVKFRLFVCPVPSTARNRLGLEAAARRARYHALRQAAEEEGARYILTGHTANDQVETILYRVFRGAGLPGLKGIPCHRPLGPAALFRPLLNFWREELLQYLNALGAKYRTDHTNATLEFSRNALRNVILPEAVAHVHPAACKSLLKLGQLAKDLDDFVSQCVHDALQRCVVHHNQTTVTLSRTQFRELHPLVMQQTILELWRRQGWPLQKMSRQRLIALRSLLAAAPSPFRGQAPGGVEVIVTEQTIILRRPGGGEGS